MLLNADSVDSWSAFSETTRSNTGMYLRSGPSDALYSRKLTSNAISFFNILADSDVREGLKAYSDWPTFPQLYTNGDLIGGLDIVSPALPHQSQTLESRNFSDSFMLLSILGQRRNVRRPRLLQTIRRSFGTEA